MRTFDGASFLPDDYEHLSEVFSKQGPYRHHKRLEDMLETLNRLWKMAEKVQDNKDLKDTGLYVSSVLSDKLYEAEVSAQCTADLIAIGGGLQALQPWAFKCKRKNFLFQLISFNYIFIYFFYQFWTPSDRPSSPACSTAT